MPPHRTRIPVPMTVTEFTAWDPHDRLGRRWQLIDGEPLVMAPGGDTHAVIRTALATRLHDHCHQHGGTCRVVQEPGIVPLTSISRNYRVPDIGVTRAPPDDGTALPSPVLVVEILTPANARATRANVWAYTTIPSILEIIIIHTAHVGAEVLRRQPSGDWPEEAEIIGPDGTLALESIAFSTALMALYPPPLAVVR